MSDSASRKGVEDVLSSVRRLVSNEMPRNRRPDLPKGPGALVLTDAQRVERPVSKGLAAKSLEDRIAELEAAVSARDDEYEPDGSEDQAQHRPDRIVYTRPPTEAEQASVRNEAARLNRLTLVEPVDVPDGMDETEQPGETVAFRHAMPLQETEAAVPDDVDQEAPMAENVVEHHTARAEIRPFHDPDGMLERFDARIDRGEVPVPGVDARPEGFSDQSATFDLDEETEHVEPAEAASSDAPVTDPQDETDFEEALNEALHSTPRAESAEPVGALEPATPGEAVTEKAESAPAAAVPGTSLDDIDEDILRPIVAQLIREELQGELGERITRNVRKLVRREILRAINSREFE